MCVSDIEGDNLLYEITKMHCGVIINPFELTEKIYIPSQEGDYLAELALHETIVGHNFKGFDLLALEKLFGFTYQGFCFDTMILSRLINPEKKFHSLDAWGNQLRFKKGDYKVAFKAARLAAGLPYQEGDEWKEFSQDMLDYCVQDVRLNVVLFLYMIVRLGWESWFGVTKGECQRLERAIREGDLKHG